MKKRILLPLLILVVLMPAVSMAESTLRVQGNATISVVPDIAVINVGHSSESADSSAVQTQTAEAITAITEAVKAQGVEEDDISTSYLNTYPVFNYTDEGQTLRGYRVEHMLTVTVRAIDTVGAVLDAALAAGANEANAITYKSSQEKEVYQQALALAIEDATAKADAMAIAAGVWLGSMDQINEITGGVATFRYAESASYDMAAGASTGSSLMTSNVEVSASVELIYEIR